jgi:hypothetical protein
MLARALLVWFSFAALILGMALFTQEMPFEWEAVSWSLLFAFPLGLSVLQGALGNAERFEYPNASFIILGLWVISMASSVIVDNPEAHLTFANSDLALLIGRWLFFLWCVVFVVVRGRVQVTATRIEPQLADMLALAFPILAALGYLVLSGRFSNYSGADLGIVKVGSSGAVAISIGQSTLLSLPGLLMLIALRANQLRPRRLATFAFFLTWPVLFLAGGRSQIGYAAGGCFFVARAVGLRFRPAVSIAIIAALPLVFFFMFTYRNALRESVTPMVTVSDFVDVAVDATSNVLADEELRYSAVTSYSENTKLRLWYGPQFYAVVDEWMDGGAGFHGSFLEGMIRIFPSWLFPGKNDIADQYNIEALLVRTGRFPDIDLGPTPWMQWLFELGFLGILFGGAFYGLLARWTDARFSRTGSLYEALFWLGMVSFMGTAEHTTDSLLIGARNSGAVIVAAMALGVVLRRLLPSSMSAEAEPELALSRPATRP